MIKLGEYNKLKVKRKAEFGYFLDAGTNNSSDDVLLHNRLVGKNKIEVGDEIEVFIYKDSEGRLAATMNYPKAKVGDIAYLKVVAHTKIGSFIDVGLPKDILVPFKAQKYEMTKGNRYLFHIYIDKSGRLAATTDIFPYLSVEHSYNIGDVVDGIVYGFQTNKSATVCVDNKYDAVILNNEYFTELNIGDKLENLKVIKIYEDGRLGLTPRGERKEELDSLEKSIMSYIEGNDGFMRFNDKSSPEEIATVFSSSKKNFKRALGVLMKKGLITQNEEGTFLK
ncbi:CvfB family protein [Terrisporobacter sp.]|uniref:CvfB family protein n=1 Tax=Terrisporobacter sp. TaxID=1965305 RepID=UPI00260621B3|nr:S1-like domain-containing RNA-binding protein [Terrisporobacter sp.]